MIYIYTHTLRHLYEKKIQHLIALIYVYIKKKEEEKKQNGKSEFPVMVDEKSIVQFSFVQPLVDIYNAWPDVRAF